MPASAQQAQVHAPFDDLDWLRALYAEQVHFVRAVLLRLRGPGADGPDVDDLLQEVFLVAHRRWPTLKDQSKPRSWLYGVALRLVAGARRRQRFRQALGLRLATEPVERATPHSSFERGEASAQLYRLLDRLPEKQRTVFVLFELDGRSGDEIAAAVGCPKKTVWTRLFHARKTLALLAASQRRREQREQQGTLS